MLQFILGRAGSGKTEYIRRMLADHSLAGKGGCVLLVPEQYSFETEKAMLRLAGPQRANAVQIYSFTRLAETVFRRRGAWRAAGSTTGAGASSCPRRWPPARSTWRSTPAPPEAAASPT